MKNNGKKYYRNPLCNKRNSRLMFIMQFWGDKFYIGQAKILARISRKYKISVGKDQVDFEVVVFIIGFFLCNFECQICGLSGGRG